MSTTTNTIRIPIEIDALIDKDCKKLDRSKNYIINQILQKHYKKVK